MVSEGSANSKRHRRSLRLGLTSVAVAFTACGTAACTSSASTSTTNSSTSTSTTPSTLPDPPVPSGHIEISGESYLTIDGLEMTVDAFVPDVAAPWPIVVAFHGRSGDFKDTASNTVIAERAAADGMLVFTPTWIAGDPFPLDVDDIVDLRNAASCAVAFSQMWATELGGDATNTVVYGFSAGAGPALAATVAPIGSVPGCEIDTAPLPVTGAVLGDGEYFYQSPAFDTAFDDDLSAMQSEVARLTARDRWPDGLGADVFVWAAEAGTAPRPLDDPAATDWLADRDPDQSIVGDLARLGQLDDEVVDYIDAAQFIELRLREADLETELRIFPGGHTVDDKIEPLVEAIRSVGATG